MIPYLKCDADGCDHRETVDALCAELIGKPCPKCGANLLTEEDYRGGQSLSAAIEALAAMGLLEEVSEPTGNEAEVSIGHHAGTTTITVKGGAA